MQHLIDFAISKIKNAKKPVSFSGAGLSAESGIATFRDKSEHALWARFDPVQLASQEGFRENPERVIDWYNWRRETLSKASPNAAHTTLAAQHNWLHITQNVDNLLESGGARENNVIHLHGTLDKDRCNSQCGYSEKVDLANPKARRDCPDCGDTLRPAVVWFGEALPEADLMRAAEAARKTDLILVIGTSAAVMPAAGLIDIARQSGADIITVNTEQSNRAQGRAQSDGALDSDIELIGKATEIVVQLFAN